MAKRYLLGFDVGSSSVKASLVDADSGKCVASAFYPEHEAPIMAEKVGWAEQDPQSWWEYAKQSLAKVIADSGAEPEEIKAIGEEFDPNFHEAVMQTPTSEHKEHTVIEELQKGYKMGDRVLRPTLVNVATSAG